MTDEMSTFRAVYLGRTKLQNGKYAETWATEALVAEYTPSMLDRARSCFTFKRRSFPVIGSIWEAEGIIENGTIQRMKEPQKMAGHLDKKVFSDFYAHFNALEEIIAVADRTKKLEDKLADETDLRAFLQPLRDLHKGLSVQQRLAFEVIVLKHLRS